SSVTSNDPPSLMSTRRSAGSYPSRVTRRRRPLRAVTGASRIGVTPGSANPSMVTLPPGGVDVIDTSTVRGSEAAASEGAACAPAPTDSAAPEAGAAPASFAVDAAGVPFGDDVDPAVG